MSSSFVAAGRCHRRRSLRMPVLFVLLALLSACAMSQQSFERLSMEVSERNDQRYKEAIDDLGGRGYVLLDDLDARYATLEEPGRTRCVDTAYHIDRLDAGPLLPAEPLKILIGEATRGNALAPPPMHVSAPAEKACAFFHQRAGELTVMKEDGSSASIVHTGGPRSLARSRSGELVLVEVQPHVIKRRKVLVKRSCDHMPRVEPDPLEVGFPISVLWGPAPKLRTVVMPIEREEFDVECTDNTY